MGDPRKQRRKYEKPQHPWKAERITQENEICKKYGLKNKKEVWKAKSAMGQLRQQARKLLASTGKEAEKETRELLSRIKRLGISDTTSVEDVLNLTEENVLERRLQTMVFRKSLANSIKQARQFITHGHIIIGNHVVSVPGYIVLKDEEDRIQINEKINKVIKVDEGNTPEQGSA